MKVPLFYILFHLKMAIYNIYQRPQLLRSVIASTIPPTVGQLSCLRPVFCVISLLTKDAAILR